MRPLQRPRHRREGDIKMDLREIGWEDAEWIHLAYGKDHWRALVNMVMNLWVPWKVRNFLTTWVAIYFSRRTMLHEVSYHTKEFRLSTDEWQ
jgi:hypothetical protein